MTSLQNYTFLMPQIKHNKNKLINANYYRTVNICGCGSIRITAVLHLILMEYKDHLSVHKKRKQLSAFKNLRLTLM